MRPFLRWAGGKRWLAVTGGVAIPRAARYVEPFLGGGAMFFSQPIRTALLADLNPYLINAYRWMQADPELLFDLTQVHFNGHNSAYYYNVRQTLDSESAADAAAFLYLNRACFNGLFRVNLAGKFNVPVGTKVYQLSDKLEFIAWSEHLGQAEIIQGDFERIIDCCGEGDFLFVDPPYTVRHNSNGFIEYNEKIFSWEDQVRLAACLWKAKERGSAFLLTNADHQTVRGLYPQECAFASRERGTEMAGKTAHRGRTTELLVASAPEILAPPLLV
jgi:DNA adenine methylase